MISDCRIACVGTLQVWYGEWLARHQILAGNVTRTGNYYMLGTTTKLLQVVGL